jgi:hypothetical protein
VNQAQKALFSILKNILIQAVPDRSQLKRLNAKVELILLVDYIVSLLCFTMALFAKIELIRYI